MLNGAGEQPRRAAGGVQLARVDDLIGGCAQLKLHRGVGPIGQRQLLAGGQYDIAARADLNHAAAVVVHFRRNQDHVTADAIDAGFQRAHIVDAARVGIAGEVKRAVQKILVTQSQRRRHQRRHINLRAFVEHHAIGVDQKHLAIGGQAPEYLRRVNVSHPVQHRRLRALLIEMRGLAHFDIKLVPLDNRPGAVGHRQRGAVAHEIRRALQHQLSRGIGLRDAAGQTKQ